MASGTAPLSWVAWTHLALLAVVLPLLALAPVPDDTPLPPRRSVYISASALLWALAGVTALVLVWEGVAPHEWGWRGASWRETLRWSALACAGALATAAAITALGRWRGWPESPWVGHLLPRNAGDRLLFVGVAATAGITEEFLYRGYVLWLGTALLGGRAWAGAALSALAFGLLHAYQRPVGVLRATCMGLWLAWPVIAGGPLAAAMIAHATADLVIGLVVGPRWARERALSR